jgi:hypothetical protein
MHQQQIRCINILDPVGRDDPLHLCLLDEGMRSWNDHVCWYVT